MCRHGEVGERRSDKGSSGCKLSGLALSAGRDAPPVTKPAVVSGESEAGAVPAGPGTNGSTRLIAGGAVSPALAASWDRSIEHGLRLEGRILFNTQVSNAETKRAVDENHDLLTHATPEMIKLYEGRGSARWLALCVDVSGRIVCFAGDRSAAARALQVLMQPGRVLLESERGGTTAPGCVLEDMRPVVITRGEHYLTELNQLFCASAPIVGPDGRLAGALDITGIDVRGLPLAGDMMTFAVRRIENSMVLAMESRVVLRFHCDERLIGTPFEGIIALDVDGVIVGANRAAGQMLLLPGDCGTGMSLDSVLEGGIDALRRGTASDDGRSINVESPAGCLALRVVERKREAARLSTTGSRPGVFDDRNGDKHGFIAAAAQLIEGFDNAVRIARAGLPIIIADETGTGKEVFARALHGTLRSEGPFLALNCAAIPEGLIEAELFGYVDGSFTGGRKRGAAGKIEQAHRGVLLLDEIGDMPLPLQARLLRVLQDRTVTRIGDSRATPVDVLVVCATHRDLEKLIAEGRFREDLYYRLCGMTVHLPPLRERADIRATAHSGRARPAGIELFEAAQAEAIRNALRDHHGNVSIAARALGISRGTLYRKMSRYGLNVAANRPRNRS